MKKSTSAQGIIEGILDYPYLQKQEEYQGRPTGFSIQLRLVENAALEDLKKQAISLMKSNEKTAGMSLSEMSKAAERMTSKLKFRYPGSSGACQIPVFDELGSPAGYPNKGDRIQVAFSISPYRYTNNAGVTLYMRAIRILRPAKNVEESYESFFPGLPSQSAEPRAYSDMDF